MLSQSLLLVPFLLPILLMLAYPCAESLVFFIYYTYSLGDLIKAQDFKRHAYAKLHTPIQLPTDTSSWKSS